MSNNQQGNVMYCYLAMPGAMPGQMGQYPQNGDGSMQGQTVPAVFGDTSQMQGFNMGNQQYGFVPAQDMQMGQAPTMMANGAMNMGGQQVMLVMNMPGQQSNQMMEGGHGNAWNPCGQDSNNSGQSGQNSGVVMQQQFQQQQQQQQQQQPQQQQTQQQQSQQPVQQQPQQQQQQQQQSQQQPQQQQFQITPSQKQGESRADNKESEQSQSAAPQTAAKPAAKRKGLQNKKLDKKEPSATADSAGSASQQASTTTGATTGTSAPAPAAAEPERPAESQTQTAQKSRWPPPAASLGATSQRSLPSGSASSIKALNLEPLFSNAPAPGRIKPIPRKELLPLDVPQPAADAAPAQTEAPAPAPQPKPTPAPTPATTPAPVPTPTPATQGTPNTTKKNFKLKNAALTRTKTTETEGQNKENKENKEENSEKPVAELPLVSNIPEEIPSARQVNQVKLMPADKVFDRELMLRIWRLQRSEVHASVSGLGTGERPAERVPERRQNPRSTPNTEIRRPTRRDPGNVLKQGENAYRVTEPTSRLEELGRRVRALLNKICPDNLKTIVETLASIELQKAEELEYVIKIIFGKALVEPHYCETYADMVFALRTRYPEFPAENEGEKPHSFTRVLLNTVQNEFESLPTTFEPTDDDKAKFPNPEDLQIEMKKRKGKMLANMKFIGNLFLRQLLAVKVIGQVVHDLVGIKEGNALPEEHMIECVCELLQAIGFTLDETTQGESLMNSFASRLKDISSIRVGGKAAFGKRIQFSIEYLLDLRKNKWQKKLFKEQAKTKAAVRDEFDREARQHGRGNAPDSMFSVQTVGVRPAYIDDIANQKKRTKTDTGPQKVKFDQAYVKKICQYFGEEKDGESLQTDWAKAQPSDKETKQGVEWLLETGFDDDKKADIVAVTLAELMKRRLVPWDTLKECFSASLSGLPELKMDAPHCDVMVHCLVARLLMLENFNQVVLKPIQTFVSHNENRDLGWSLLLGIIKKLKTEKANDIVKKALSISEFASCAATARNTTVSDAKKLLESA